MGYVVTPPDLHRELEAFYAAYARTMDERRPTDWIAMFDENGVYAVTTHNNYSTTGMWWYTDRGIKVLKERAAYASGYFWHVATKTLHTITNVVGSENSDGEITAGAYFALYVADRGDLSRLHVCGVFYDKFVRYDGGLRLREHRVVIDSETVPPNMGVLL
jgi:3-phenylpropionate/cinnamic acid dioxygenase small subunit